MRETKIQMNFSSLASGLEGLYWQSVFLQLAFKPLYKDPGGGTKGQPQRLLHFLYCRAVSFGKPDAAAFLKMIDHKSSVLLSQIRQGVKQGPPETLLHQIRKLRLPLIGAWCTVHYKVGDQLQRIPAVDIENPLIARHEADSRVRRRCPVCSPEQH